MEKDRIMEENRSMPKVEPVVVANSANLSNTDDDHPVALVPEGASTASFSSSASTLNLPAIANPEDAFGYWHIQKYWRESGAWLGGQFDSMLRVDEVHGDDELKTVSLAKAAALDWKVAEGHRMCGGTLVKSVFVCCFSVPIAF